MKDKSVLPENRKGTTLNIFKGSESTDHPLSDIEKVEKAERIISGIIGLLVVIGAFLLGRHLCQN